MNFGVKNFFVKINDSEKKKKKTLMFKLYNLMDSIELGVITFGGSFPRM
jgi:hypothetical protein